jgi:acyl-CoA synthetase (AMP-forming)/AMP-acid ligase II
MAEHTGFRLMADMIRHHAAERGDKVAMIFEGRETRYRDLDAGSSRVANAIIAEGVAPQGRVAILAKNTDLFFELYYGTTKAGAVLVPVNSRLAPPEVAFVIEDARAELLFVSEDYYELVEGIRDRLDTVKTVIALQDNHPDWTRYSSWRDAWPATDPTRDSHERETCIQVYSSGTTGHPKGVELTHHNLMALLPVAIEEWGSWQLDDVSIVAMPLFHVAGCEWGFVAFYVGGTNVLMAEVDPAAILRTIPEYGVTKALFVPAVILFLLQAPGCAETDFSSLESVVYGASPIPLPVLQRAIEVFGCNFAQVYGLTETSGAVTYLPPEDHDGGERMRSCGRAMRSARIRVVDAEGVDCPPGSVGEILVAGDQVMKGYWNQPEATAEAIRDGWFHTGDAGYLDADGYLYIHDRVKDMIVSGGENIYPAEIESALAAHPGVADIGVIGIPDDTWGETVMAFVVRRADTRPTEAELDRFARENLAGYKVPRRYQFVDELPRSPSGKLLKRELRKPFWADQERQVH